MTLCSDKQPSSAQGSVFFINYGHDSEVILKSFKKKDIVSYQKEIAVLKKLREIGDNIEGFPKLISHKETENSAEFIINVSQSFRLSPLFYHSLLNFAICFLIGSRTEHTKVDAVVPDAEIQHTTN